VVFGDSPSAVRRARNILNSRNTRGTIKRAILRILRLFGGLFRNIGAHSVLSPSAYSSVLFLPVRIFCLSVLIVLTSLAFVSCTCQSLPTINRQSSITSYRTISYYSIYRPLSIPLDILSFRPLFSRIVCLLFLPIWTSGP
jgi:hypothetical protein